MLTCRPRNYHLLREVTDVLGVSQEDFILLNNDMSFVEIPLSKWRPLEARADGVFGGEVVEEGRPLLRPDESAEEQSVVKVKDGEVMVVLVEVDSGLKQMLDISTETLAHCEQVQKPEPELAPSKATAAKCESKVVSGSEGSLSDEESRTQCKESGKALEALLKGGGLGPGHSQALRCEQVKKPCRVALFDIKHSSTAWKINGQIDKKSPSPTTRKKGVKVSSANRGLTKEERPTVTSAAELNEGLERLSLSDTESGGPHKGKERDCPHIALTPASNKPQSLSSQSANISGMTSTEGNVGIQSQCSAQSLEQIQKNHLNGFVFNGKVQQLVTRDIKRKKCKIFTESSFGNAKGGFSTALFQMLTTEKPATAKDKTPDNKESKKVLKVRRRADPKGTPKKDGKDRKEESGDTALPVLEKHDTEDEQSSDEVQVNTPGDREMPQLTPCAF